MVNRDHYQLPGVPFGASDWEKLILDVNGHRDGALLDPLDAFPEINARLGKRSVPADPTAGRTRDKAHVEDGSDRPGIVSLEPNCLSMKG